MAASNVDSFTMWLVSNRLGRYASVMLRHGIIRRALELVITSIAATTPLPMAAAAFAHATALAPAAWGSMQSLTQKNAQQVLHRTTSVSRLAGAWHAEQRAAGSCGEGASWYSGRGRTVNGVFRTTVMTSGVFLTFCIVPAENSNRVTSGMRAADRAACSWYICRMWSLQNRTGATIHPYIGDNPNTSVSRRPISSSVSPLTEMRSEQPGLPPTVVSSLVSSSALVVAA